MMINNDGRMHRNRINGNHIHVKNKLFERNLYKQNAQEN